jgi:outer membrane protein assembly factor BamB
VARVTINAGLKKEQKYKLFRNHIFFFVYIISAGLLSDEPAFFCQINSQAEVPLNSSCSDTTEIDSTSNIQVLIPTFLGNEKRNFYGNTAPSRLDLIWKIYLGKGKTVISRKIGEKIWAGAGWTGQPLLVLEDSVKYLIQGAFDHNLKKINAETGEIVWQYKFDDVVKGTGTIWINEKTNKLADKYVILQGSRLGVENFLDSRYIPSFRAISYITGKELWRLNSKLTDSYSRDVDGSALIVHDTAYIGLENSLFTVIDPDYRKATLRNGMLQPKIIQERKLYRPEDVKKHEYNIVTESSPCLLEKRIYITSGSGHVFGYDLNSRELEWDFYVGADIDGSPVVTHDSCIIVTLEKQFIKGKGGVFKLNPKKNPGDAVVWFQPSENSEFVSWKGGVIGSVGINDYYNDGNYPYLAATTGIDGFLYVVDHKTVESGKKVLGPDSLSYYPAPEIIYKKYIGPSISTPIFVENKLIVAGYYGLFLFEFDRKLKFNLLDKFETTFETTPITYDKRIYIASRDGYLYCIGKK